LGLVPNLALLNGISITDMPFDPGNLTQQQRRQFLQALVYLENSYEVHFPGRHYIGPGTHVISNVINGILPYDKNDAIALIHDINYLLHPGEDVTYYDNLAIDNFDPFTFSGLTGKLGLTIKKLLPVEFNNKLPTKTLDETKIIGSVLQKYVLNDQAFLNELNKHGLNLTDTEKTDLLNTNGEIKTSLRPRKRAFLEALSDIKMKDEI
jgi:hypothetical protein